VFGAAFLLRGMMSAMGRIEALSYWVVSDHFEELGRPPALLHGGFGLRTVGDLRKPRWWALELLERLGPHRLEVTMSGDGGGALVEALAARRRDGTVGVLVWNGTLDQSKAGGSNDLARHITLQVAGLDDALSHRLCHSRVDADHSNISSVWARIGRGADWPDDEQWVQLRRADRLDELQPVRTLQPADAVTVEFDLPMPGISYLELTPQ
jgi:xylan 1,4-beta-xylosidase